MPGRYVVELQADAAVDVMAKQARPGARHAARSADFAARRAAVREGQRPAHAEIARSGGTVVDSLDTVANALIVTIADSRAAALGRIAGVKKVHPVRRVHATLNHAAVVHNVGEMWSQLPQGQEGAGAGMKVAVVDSGVDARHPAFQDALPALDGFPKVNVASDAAFTNAKVIVARNYTSLLGRQVAEPDADDRDGHGTGTAMAAAGGVVSSPYGRLSGVAPKAYIGSYKVLSASYGTTTDVVAKALDDAVADGMDVINVSIGGPVLFQSDVDPDGFNISAFERAAKAGVIVTVAAGNSGPDAGTIGDFASAPSVISVGAIDNNRIVAAAITVDGAAPYLGVPGATNPFSPVSGPMADVARLDPSGLACTALAAGSLSGKIAVILRGTCSFETKLNTVSAAGAIGAIIYNNSTAVERVNMVTGTATLPAMFTNNKEGLELKTRSTAAEYATLDFTNWDSFPAAPALIGFSSRGPSLGMGLKPDLLAVGAELITAAQSRYANGDSYSASGYINTQGTSFSAPIVAGAAAALKASRPGLTVAQYRSLLINSAAAALRSDDTPTTVVEGGTGRMDLAAANASTVAVSPTSLNFGYGEAAKNTLDLTLWNLGASGDTFTVSVMPGVGSSAPVLTADTVTVEAGASSDLKSLVDTTSLTPGEYSGYLQVSGTQGQPVAKIPYWFAVTGTPLKAISVVYSDASNSARAASSQAVIVRLLDEAGLPYTGTEVPSARVLTAGTVTRIYRYGDFPGTYALDVRMGTSDLAVSISAGAVTQTAVIPVN
ncbi:MAG: S8 family serine peptidase [Acidobacteria bacterium]|nr:S8 family serine peptidase [Acidobacteriota bacterium]